MTQPNTQKVFVMSNDRMMPHIHPGDTLFFKKQNRVEYIRWGELYYTVAANGEFIGRLKQGTSPDTALSVSSNPLFLDVEIPRGEIKELYIFHQMYSEVL